jgi:hypothetical protein
MSLTIEDTLLLVLDRERMLIPLSPEAFTRANRSRRKLRTEYTGALIIYRAGKVLPIERIEVLGLLGSSIFAKFMSALNSDWSIKVHFGPETGMNLDEFKALVIQYLGYDMSERGDPFLPQEEPLETVYQSVRSATNFAEVFERIHVPPPEDALDGL